MRPLSLALAVAISALLLLGQVSSAAGTGIKAYGPSETAVTATNLPFSYNGSFVVQNDGYLEGVYVVRVAVDDPAAVGWINVSPSGFVLAPGELKLINFSMAVPEGEAGRQVNVIFMPELLPQNVEPYMDTFASYVAYVDRFNFTLEVPGNATGIEQAAGGQPVIFSPAGGQLNLIQYQPPTPEDKIVTQIDRAVRINAPAVAPVGQPIEINLSVFQDLPAGGIQLMAVSPEGDFYPSDGGNFTFSEQGRWGIVALVASDLLLGRPVDVGPNTVQWTLPGLDTIAAAVALLVLLAAVPLWFMGRRPQDPYENIAYKAYVIRKYIGQFDPPRLGRAVRELLREYDDLVARGIRGDREEARSSLDELLTLSRLESD